MSTVQQVQKLFQSKFIRTKLVEMKGLTHVTVTQSHTKNDGIESSTCTEQIILRFLYQQQLNLDFDTINYTCSFKENLIGIDWFYSNPTVNQTLYIVFANSTTNYWGINMTDIEVEPIINESNKFNTNLLLLILPIFIFYLNFY
ncbi:unnamed protein product [Rotaria sordida]|uniref:Uncharacterized protein n=1 Tax=Rotaria sordida TaxID=392033 RepID=A0A816ABC6_9BILA|nr:unnamed protein product [Rotaria sordida]CAF1593672.1 unnamed protein product [Rotaria sordida]